MPKEILLPESTALTGQEKVRMIDKDGRSVQVPLPSFNNYVSRASYYSIFDGDTDVLAWSESTSNVAAIDEPLRLGFSGPLTDADYWPLAYGDVLENSISAPASSNFDFRLFTEADLGSFLSFDFELSARLHDDNGFRLNRALPLIFEVTFPNGDVKTETIIIPNEFIAATSAVTHSFRVTFTTYINNVLLDSLQGGSIRVFSANALSASEILDLTKLKATVRL